MKKNLVMLVLVAFFVLSACGSGSNNAGSPSADAVAQTETASKGESTRQEDDNQGIEVKKSAQNVEITLPASFIESEDIEQEIEEAKAEGVTDVRVNADGSITYVMPKAVHEQKMKELRDELVQALGELKGGQTFSSIKDITYNDKFSEFTLIVDKAAYEGSFDGFAVFGLGIQGMLYQAFDGVPTDKVKVTINVEDQQTGEVFDTVVFPDQMQP